MNPAATSAASLGGRYAVVTGIHVEKAPAAQPIRTVTAIGIAPMVFVVNVASVADTGAPVGDVDAMHERGLALVAAPHTRPNTAVRTEPLVLVAGILTPGTAAFGNLVPVAAVVGDGANGRVDEAVAWESIRRHLCLLPGRTRHCPIVVATEPTWLIVPIGVATDASRNARRVPEVSFRWILFEYANLRCFEIRVGLQKPFGVF